MNNEDALRLAMAANRSVIIVLGGGFQIDGVVQLFDADGFVYLTNERCEVYVRVSSIAAVQIVKIAS